MNALARSDRVVTQLLELLHRMEQRGVLLDTQRLANLNYLLDERIGVLQRKFNADTVLPQTYHPKGGYKKKPKDGAGPPKQLKGPTELVQMTPDRWAWQKPFNPNHWKSVLDYSKALGHPVKRLRDGSESSDQKGLLYLWRKTQDDHYRDFVEFRKLIKMRGTYGKWPSSVFDDHHRLVRTHYTIKPVTGRLSSTKPNLQNIPKDGELAEMFRHCIVPRPGNVFVRADMVSAEAVAMGWFAEDDIFIRLAKLGIHKYAMARYLGIPVDLTLPDNVIAAFLDKVKEGAPEALYQKIKVGVYGSMYLVGARTQFEQNPDVFENQADAKKFIQFCLGLSPKIQAHQRRIVAQVTRSKYYQNPFGRRIPFWDLPGGDGPAVVSAGPQSIVADVMIESMLQIGAMGIGQWMVMQVHDELVFDVPADLAQAVAGVVVKVMSQPWSELDGLAIPVKVKVSESFA